MDIRPPVIETRDGSAIWDTYDNMKDKYYFAHGYSFEVGFKPFTTMSVSSLLVGLAWRRIDVGNHHSQTSSSVCLLC